MYCPNLRDLRFKIYDVRIRKSLIINHQSLFKGIIEIPVLLAIVALVVASAALFAVGTPDNPGEISSEITCVDTSGKLNVKINYKVPNGFTGYLYPAFQYGVSGDNLTGTGSKEYTQWSLSSPPGITSVGLKDKASLEFFKTADGSDTLAPLSLPANCTGDGDSDTDASFNFFKAGDGSTLEEGTITVSTGSKVRLAWSTNNATSCTGSSSPAGLFSGNKPTTYTTGHVSTPDITVNQNSTFTLTCEPGSVSKSVQVNVSGVATPLAIQCPTSGLTVNNNLSFSAWGGIGSFSWSAPSGNPSSGSGSTFVTKYANAGTYTISASSGSETKSCSLTVGPASSSYTLIISKTGTGSGTVTANTGTLNCGTTCSAIYNSGTSITITATPAANSTFVGWSGDCSGTSITCNLVMSSSKQVTATFNSITDGSASCLISPKNNFENILKGTSTSFSLNASNLKAGNVVALYNPDGAAGNDKNFPTVLSFNGYTSITSGKVSDTATAGGSVTFNFTLQTTDPYTPEGKYTIAKLYVAQDSTKTECKFNSSSGITFDVSSQGGGGANEKPTIASTPTGPADVIVGETKSYSSQATDKDGDKVYFLFEIYEPQSTKAETATTTLSSAGCQTPCTGSLNYTFKKTGVYKIRALTYDESGVSAQSFSNFLTVTSADKPGGGLPQNLKVANGPSCSDGNYTLTLTWENSGVDWYADLSTNSDFSNYSNKNVSGQTSTQAATGFGSAVGLNPPTVLYPDTNYYWRVWNGATHTNGPGFKVSSCTTPNQPPTVAHVTGPTTGMTETKYAFSAQASDPNNNKIYIKFVIRDSDSKIVSQFDSVKTSSGCQTSCSVTTEQTFYYPSTYTIDALAVDEKDLTAPTWGRHVIAISKAPVNTAPNKPSTPSGPTTAKVGETQKYVSQATDPDGDKLKIIFTFTNKTANYTNQEDSSRISYSPQSCLNPCSREYSYTFTQPGVFEVNTIAIDEKNLSQTSDFLTVTVGTTPPLNPELGSFSLQVPEAGQQGINQNPSFSWTESQNASHYYIFIGNQDGWQWYKKVSGTYTEWGNAFGWSRHPDNIQSVTPPQTLPLGLYAWTVEAFNTDESKSKWGNDNQSGQTFRVGVEDSGGGDDGDDGDDGGSNPIAPTVNRIVSGCETATITWTGEPATNVGSSSQTGFVIRLSPDSNFAQLHSLVFAASSKGTFSENTNKLSPTIRLKDNKKYYVQVNNQLSSEVTQFTHQAINCDENGREETGDDIDFIPAKPTNIEATKTCNSDNSAALILSWSSARGAARYYLERTQGSFDDPFDPTYRRVPDSLTPQNPIRTDSPLPSNSYFTYRVVAVSPRGTIETRSNPVSYTTSNCAKGSIPAMEAKGQIKSDSGNPMVLIQRASNVDGAFTAYFGYNPGFKENGYFIVRDYQGNWQALTTTSQSVQIAPGVFVASPQNGKLDNFENTEPYGSLKHKSITFNIGVTGEASLGQVPFIVSAVYDSQIAGSPLSPLTPSTNSQTAIINVREHTTSSFPGCPYGWPTTGKVSQGPEGATSHGSGGHEAIDIATPVGTDVYATINGTVVGISDPGSNKTLEVRPTDCEGLYLVKYLHLSGIDVSVGDIVRSGQKIADSGTSGQAHLHYQFNEDGDRSFPIQTPYIPKNVSSRTCDDRFSSCGVTITQAP